MRGHLAGLLMVCGALATIAGCASTPSTRIQQPMTAKPVEQKTVAAQNGAIFQAGVNERPLFEDRRARNVGDILTIVISEATSASEKTSSNAEHSGSVSATTPNITGNLHGSTATAATPVEMLGSLGTSGKSSGKLANKSDTAGSNAFTGNIAVTVIEVLPNGNLLVGGEKQVAIGQSDEFIRFSGVVNPTSITGSNTVSSTQVADVHLEYKGTSSVDRSAITSIFSRMFFSVVPF
ncbi:MAG: flagellar L-ring protein precursor FlgH [Gallionellaceae bacterium]|nr:MAG: flagellar L-ring protein precursor FlgH [Gallionellaceae bacterium]